MDPHPSAEALSAAFARAAEAARVALDAPGLTAAFVTAAGQSGAVGVGLADRESGRAMAPTSRMLGGSTGKSFVAATALGLARQGRIDLDAPLARWLGSRRWFGRLPNARALTLRHLLRHAGGVPDHMGDPGLLDRFRQGVASQGPDFHFAPEQAVGFILDLPPIAPAGAGFFYSDTGYIIAGLALEAATGEDLYDLIAGHVLEPLGMSATEPSRTRHYRDLAIPYFSSAEGPVRHADPDGALPFSPRSEWAGGGFVTAAPDLARFIHAYAGGTLFDGPYLDEILQPNRHSWGEGHLGAYGLGLFMADSPLGPAIGHGGYYPGYRSQMTHFPEAGISVAWQCNQAPALDSYSNLVETRVAAAAKALDPDAPLSMVEDAASKLAQALVEAGV